MRRLLPDLRSDTTAILTLNCARKPPCGRSLLVTSIFFRHARRGFASLSMSERSQPRRVGLQNVCIFLERNGDWGVYPCFDSADSLARVRMLRAVSCRVHSVTLAWPTFTGKIPWRAANRTASVFDTRRKRRKIQLMLSIGPSACESVASAGYVSMRHSDASDDQITHFRCEIPVPAIINSRCAKAREHKILFHGTDLAWPR